MVNFACVNLNEEEEGMNFSSNDSNDFENLLEEDEDELNIDFDQETLKSKAESRKRVLATAKGSKIKVPRLLVRDIRKSYPAMIANVVNSCNFSMLYGFLDTFFDINVRFTRVRQFADERRNSSLHLNNVYELAKFWYSLMRMSPDSVMRLTDPRIQYTTGNIISNLDMCSTFLYEAPMDAGYFASYIFLDDRYGKQVLYANDKRMNEFVVGRKYTSISFEDTLSDEKLQDMKDIQSSVDRVVDTLPLRLNPERVQAKGTFVLSTDENKRITNIEAILNFDY